MRITTPTRRIAPSTSRATSPAAATPGQQSRDHTTRLEFQNMTTMSHGAHAIKFGTRMRDTRDANFTNANFNGSFTFDSADELSERWPTGLAS